MVQSDTKAFHVMAKPTGARCNLNCAYCFFLKKEALYPGSNFRMSDEVMEQFIRQTIAAHQTPQVTLAWQGGEPTLMGLDFFRRAVEVAKCCQKPGTTIEHTIQTNGILLNEEWCQFLHENRFLVGLSLDGPRQMHDAYRRDLSGNSVFDQVVRSVRLMQRYDVDFNILCTVNAVNSLHPLELYRFFRDELKTPYLQFIPIVEPSAECDQPGGQIVSERSVQAEQYGRFLIEIFDEWVKHDVGQMFVLTFDGVLAAWLRGYSTLCVFQPACGQSVALEHNGDVYSCDHFVEPQHLLGNIMRTSLVELVNSEQQQHFGAIKSVGLPRQCKQCRFLFSCHGECPKNRVLKTLNGEMGLNWLCAGLKAFFEHTQKPMQVMAALLRQGRTAAEVMNLDRMKANGNEPATASPGRNEACYCGSGLKFKKCHGK